MVFVFELIGDAVDVCLHNLLLGRAFIEALDGLHNVTVVVLENVMQIAIHYFISFEAEQVRKLLIELDKRE